ncbi:FHA domain-containing protein [Niallia endozanthoxylica]|uniref:FHA domain-containing protein n=1 Tax=Niallia endozanthoxylica TaxID=2036016 RepID=A0A5J5HQA1_9BACI|nr:FHA domain-containing protein [Niallia endozanthoxylica]KAA9023912.1 FHA domain-containing protein [Niallia endozanthoxylica]
MECRICEYCEHQNDTSFLECEKCGADISFVHPTIIKEEKKDDHEFIDDSEGEKEKRAVNETQEKKEKQPMRTMRLAQLKLVSMKDGFVVDIPFEGGIIGRDGTIASHYFEDNLYVSSEHAEILLKNDGYVIIDQHSTNGTKINGKKVEKSIEYSIKPGDHITFANMNFKLEE